MPLAKLPARIKPLDPPKQRGWDKDGRPSAKDRGYGWEWQKLRDSIMVRDHGLCQPCKRHGFVTLARDVDHIVNKAQGGTDHPANLQAICSGPDSCHEAKTQAESHGADWDEDAHFAKGGRARRSAQA